MRVPTIAWWPGIVPAGVTSAALSSTLDLLPTCCRLAGVDPPGDRVLDGYDLTATLVEQQPSPRKEMFYYRGTRLMAVRLGDYKAHYITQDAYGPGARNPEEHVPPRLYQLGHDPGEQWDVADEHPEVIEEITALAEKHREKMEMPPSELER